MNRFTSVEAKFSPYDESVKSAVLHTKPDSYSIKVTGSLSIDFSGLWPVLCTECVLGRKQILSQK